MVIRMIGSNLLEVKVDHEVELTQHDVQAAHAKINVLSTGKPIVLNGKSKFSRDMKALGVEVTGIRGAADRGGRLRAISAPITRLFGRGAKGPKE